jgi:hypothetical protein
MSTWKKTRIIEEAGMLVEVSNPDYQAGRASMSKVTVSLEFDKYRYGDSDPFKRKGGGWLTLDELRERITSALDKVISMMDTDDQLTITIEAESPKEI